MSLYKTKHLTFITNKRKKSFKLEIVNVYEGGSGTSQVWFMDGFDNPYWTRNLQSTHPYYLTGKLRFCLKSKGRGRPHMFQTYKAPVTERAEECLYIN